MMARLKGDILAHINKEHLALYPGAELLGADWYRISAEVISCTDHRDCCCRMRGIAAYTTDLTARPIPDYEHSAGYGNDVLRLSIPQRRRIGVGEITRQGVLVRVEEMTGYVSMGETIEGGRRRKVRVGDEIYLDPKECNAKVREWLLLAVAAGRQPSVL